MFTFYHPRPVTSFKPVAELAVRRSSVAADSPRAITVMPSQNIIPLEPSPARTHLSFSVSYTLAEYLSFIKEYTPVIAEREYLKRGKSFPGVSPFQSALTQTIASAGFFYKRWRMGTCHFLIDAAGLRRRTARGELLVAWADVIQVHECTAGLLVAKRQGVFPLPYRCMTDAQKSSLRELVSRWRTAAPVNNLTLRSSGRPAAAAEQQR